MRSKRQNPFTLIELLVVIAILAILMSLLIPTFNSTHFYVQNLQCIYNLKTQGLAYTLYCNDNDDLYPGIREDTKQIRRRLNNYDRAKYGGQSGFENNDYDYRFDLQPYFEIKDGADMENGSYSNYIDALKCPLGSEVQSHPTWNTGKRYYALFYNAAEPWTSVNLTTYDFDYTNPNRMHQLGDTWTWTRVFTSWSPGWEFGVPNLEFNALAMDALTVSRGNNVTDGISSNHFSYAPDLIPANDWGPDSFSRSRVGEVVLNIVFDDGSTQSVRATRTEMYKDGENGWNCRGGNGDGGSMFALPRYLSVGRSN